MPPLPPVTLNGHTPGGLPVRRQVFNVEDVGELLNRSRVTVRRWVHDGRFHMDSISGHLLVDRVSLIRQIHEMRQWRDAVEEECWRRMSQFFTHPDDEGTPPDDDQPEASNRDRDE